MSQGPGARPSIAGVAVGGLGEHLAARRALIDPVTTGLALGSGRRRVPGLRREEVAVLAGVSVDYYRRLEQGRERNPSPAVLEALARALALADDAREHLHRLAGTPARGTAAVVVRPRVSAHLQGLLQLWLLQPAFVLGPALDVLAANALATALFEGFGPADNVARMAFLDPHGRSFFVDLDRARLSCVASLRHAGTAAPDDAHVDEVVAGLLDASPEFSALWARHDARGKGVETKRLHHPTVGALTLTSQVFDVRGAPGQELVVWSTPPGSASAASLVMLGSLSAGAAVSGAHGRSHP